MAYYNGKKVLALVAGGTGSGSGLTIINHSETTSDNFKAAIVNGSYTNYIIKDDLNGSKETYYYPYGDIYNDGSVYFLSVNAEVEPVAIKSLAWDKATGESCGSDIVAEFESGLTEEEIKALIEANAVITDGSLHEDEIAVGGTTQGEVKGSGVSINDLATKTEVEAKQDKLTAGDNITIAEDGTISAEGGSPITYVDTLPEANEEEFEKHKIYQQGSTLKFIGCDVPDNPPISLENTLPQNICNAPSATVGDNIYIIGGQTSYSTSAALNTIYKYNTTTNTLTTTSATLQTSYACACAVGNNIYIFGGTKKFENESKNIVRFNTLTDSVEIVYTNTKYFKYGACAAVGTNIYLFGGTNYTSNIQKFDTTTNTLTTLSTNLPAGRITLSVGVANNNNIYLFGGDNSSWTRQKTIYKFNPSTNVIETLTATLPENLSGAIVSNEINGCIYIIGGSTTSGVSNVIYRFNVSTETIETMPQTFSINIKDAACGGNGDFYTFGGLSTSNGSALNSIYKLNFGLVYSFKTIVTE